jgi:TPR repeat protein
MRCVALAFFLGVIAAVPQASGADRTAPDPVHLTDEANKYFTGTGAPQDDTRAATLYRQAAELGYARAMHNLGFMYAQGRGVPHDEFKAVDYYRAAMAQSYIPAMTSLGIAYAEGLGVSREAHTAAALLRQAAAAGDKRAKDYLARANLPP